MNTHESYVSLEVAKLLKGVGFNIPVFTLYMKNREGEYELNRYGLPGDWNNRGDDISAPTLNFIHKWLREEKNIIVEVMFSNTGHNYFVRYCDVTVHGFDDGHWHRIGINDGYETYEEALEAGIKDCLERLLEQKEKFGIE